MNPIDQQIAIAESIGWTDVKPYVADVGRLWGYSPGPDPDFTSVPTYLEDLNAMHEVEKNMSPEQYPIYFRNLVPAEIDWIHHNAWEILCFATAAQRAEAYLRTVGKWKD